MRTLVGIANFSIAKAYCADKLGEMLEQCVEPALVTYGAEIVIYGDTDLWGGRWPWERCTSPGTYSEDMLMVARDMMLHDGATQGYDKVVFQGADAFWQSLDDFEKMLDHELPLVSPLISARGDVSHAVCRRFTSQLKGTQEQVPRVELMSGRVIPVGFCNADGWCIDRELFGVPFSDGHKPWYERVRDGEENLCVEEEWIRRLHVEGWQAFCDTSVTMWHAHDIDGLAKLWPDVEVPISELSW